MNKKLVYTLTFFAILPCASFANYQLPFSSALVSDPYLGGLIYSNVASSSLNVASRISVFEDSVLSIGSSSPYAILSVQKKNGGFGAPAIFAVASSSDINDLIASTTLAVFPRSVVINNSSPIENVQAALLVFGSPSTTSTFVQMVNSRKQATATNGAFVVSTIDDNTPVATSTRLGGWAMGGAYNYSHSLVNSVAIESFADQTFSTSTAGSYLRFSVTPLGSASRVESMRILNNGYVAIGTTTATQKLSVDGYVIATGYLDYSPIYTGDGLSAINNIKIDTTKSISSKDWGEVDHSSLPKEVSTTTVVKTSDIFDGSGTIIVRNATTQTVTARDLGKELQIAIRAIQQIQDEIIIIQEQIKSLTK
jgi:hypothetical protein